MSTHEPSVSYVDHARVASDRQFGLVMTAFFAAVAVWPLWRGQPVRFWAAAVAVLFLAPALARPRVLHPLNIVWTRLGLLLGAVVTPVVTALVFALTVVPIGLLMRSRTRQRLDRDPSATTYWLARTPPGPPPPSMTNLF